MWYFIALLNVKDFKRACAPYLVFTEKHRKREQRKKTELTKEVVGDEQDRTEGKKAGGEGRWGRKERKQVMYVVRS